MIKFKKLSVVATVLFALNAKAQSTPQAAFCALSNTPTVAQMQSALTSLAQQAQYTVNTTVDVTFDPAASSTAAAGETSCTTGLFSSSVSCTIDMNPTYLNPVTAPITFTHELFHADCSENNCPVNVGLDMTANGTSYSNTPGQPFDLQELYTHYSDYVGFLSATLNAVDNGDQATATYAANWAYFSALNYNNIATNATNTLGLINAALSNYANDTTLASTGKSGDGQLSISFNTFSLTATTFAGTPIAGQPGIQVTLLDPSAANQQISAQFVLTDPTIGSSNYSAGLAFVQQQMNSTLSYMANLPSQLPTEEVYDVMAGAGYAPANVFNTSNLLDNFFSYTPGVPGAQLMLYPDLNTINAALVPENGVAQAPVCSNQNSNSSCNINIMGGGLNLTQSCTVSDASETWVTNPLASPPPSVTLPSVLITFASGQIYFQLPSPIKNGNQYTYVYGSSYYGGAVSILSPLTACFIDSVNNPSAYIASKIAGWNLGFSFSSNTSTSNAYHGSLQAVVGCDEINGVPVSPSATVLPSITINANF